VKFVVDASVAVKWVVQEEGRSDALRHAAGGQLIAPEFVLVEVASILWKKRRLGQLDAEQAQRGLAFVTGAYERLVPTGELIARALALAIELDHPAYDCLYLACAELEEADLLTADARLSQKAKPDGGHRVVVLGNAAP
jgi:predicted nucleic acid-binding protein